MNMTLSTNTTYFVGTHYEVVDNGTTQKIIKYYGVYPAYGGAGSQRIAMRTDGVLNFILGDHLGSTSLVTDASGVIVSQQYYKAWGETRYTSGTEQTKYGYTGQYSYAADFGLHFYNARWYDSSLSRFAQADTIVPGGVQGYDRFAYANNNPLNYNDPSGHDGVPWSFTLNSSMLISGVNNIGNSLGISNLNQSLANLADLASFGLDGAALTLDVGIVALEVAAASIGATAGVATCPTCTPITGPVGALLGYEIVDLGTRPALKLANALGTASTAATAYSDILSGESSIEITAHGDLTSAYLDASGYIGKDTYISGGLTIAGNLAPNAIASTPFQIGALANDFGLFRKGPELMSIGDRVSKLDKGLGFAVKTSGQAISLLPPKIPFKFKDILLWK